MTTVRRNRVRVVRQFPEPGRFWIAAGPRIWPAAAGPWTDLANSRLVGFQGRPATSFPELEAGTFDGLFYLPPVDPSLAAERDRFLVDLAADRTPVLQQLAPGESPHPEARVAVYDLARSLLAGEPEGLAEVSAGMPVVWPLIAGLTDRRELWEAGCELLAGAGARCVQPVAVELDPTVRRALAEERDDEEVWRALFHGRSPLERDFSRCAAHFGLAAFIGRPETGPSPRRRRNRRLAGTLALAGELWLRLERPVSQGQALLRAARGAEESVYDLVALVREDNLGLMEWLDSTGVELIREHVAEGRSSLVESLLEEYLGTPSPPLPGGREGGPGRRRSREGAGG